MKDQWITLDLTHWKLPVASEFVESIGSQEDRDEADMRIVHGLKLDTRVCTVPCRFVQEVLQRLQDLLQKVALSKPRFEHSGAVLSLTSSLKMCGKTRKTRQFRDWKTYIVVIWQYANLWACWKFIQWRCFLRFFEKPQHDKKAIFIIQTRQKRGKKIALSLTIYSAFLLNNLRYKQSSASWALLGG